MATVEETIIWDKIERSHRSPENKYNKNPAITAKLTGSSPRQSRPASSAWNHKYMICECTHHH